VCVYVFPFLGVQILKHLISQVCLLMCSSPTVPIGQLLAALAAQIVQLGTYLSSFRKVQLSTFTW